MCWTGSKPTHSSNIIPSCCKLFCHFCHFFSNTEEAHKKHVDNCRKLNIVQAVRYPTDDKKWLRFEEKNLRKTIPLPFVIYADFESILGDCPGTDQYCGAAYQKHAPISYCINVKSIDHRWNRKPEVYTGLDCMRKFMETMDLLNEEIRDVFKLTHPMTRLSTEEEILHRIATHCYACNRRFESTAGGTVVKKFRDHCHITGKYRGMDISLPISC